ncbi:MAG TPA: COX15/CtaA family protein [Candidatus Lumbricidophila sp.]|nr:COX15/CtaA family protein [Candidatus Lumbricidophila sp.]
MPSSVAPVSRALGIAAWASFAAQVAIIGTGGAVRLTGSGLGCPTWPTCTPDSLIPTAELSWHSAIEFGNRMMTGLLSIIAVLVLVLVWRIRRERRDLWALGWIVLGGVIAQAIVGGITVWTGLNPFIVGFHYIASVSLVCVTAVFLFRFDTRPGARELAVPAWFAGLAHGGSGVLAVSLAMGVLTTGAGPHSGDQQVGRSGFDATLLEHIHAWPGYAFAVIALALVILSAINRMPTLQWSVLLLVLVLMQVALGLYQARTGLPPFAVGAHMVLAALVAATMTLVVLSLKREAVAPSPLESPESKTLASSTAADEVR